MNKPVISIILPVYNEKLNYLTACLESIKNQTFKDWECVLVVESDRIDNINLLKNWCAADNRFLLVTPATRLGLAGSLNLGVELSNTDIIARMDSDDVMFPQRLELQLKFLEENPDVSIVGCNYELIDHEGKKIGYRRYPSGGFLLGLYFQFRCGLAHPSVILRKSDFISLNGYDSNLSYCEDLDLWLRYRRVGAKIRNMDQALIRYRRANRPKVHWKKMVQVRLSNVMRKIYVRK